MEFWRDLWNNKPLLLVVVAAVGLLLYLVYKTGPGSSQPQGQTIATPHITTVEGAEPPPQIIVQQVPQGPNVFFPPNNGQKKSIFDVRQPGAFPGYDTGHTGVQVYQSTAWPTGNTVVGILPWGSAQQPIGAIVTANGMQWYPVSGGYVLVQDLVAQS